MEEVGRRRASWDEEYVTGVEVMEVRA